MPLILIVDDSPTEVHVMQKALEKHGYRTAAAADGAEGVRLAREMSPDLIFMDIVMPGMNGYQATRALANDPKTRTIPIIMVTSKGQETDRIWGLRQGAVDYMVKPVSPDQLVAKAQARMLDEGVSEVAPFAPELPVELRPSRRFDDARIRAALPDGRFTMADLRFVGRRSRRRGAASYRQTQQ